MEKNKAGKEVIEPFCLQYVVADITHPMQNNPTSARSKQYAQNDSTNETASIDAIKPYAKQIITILRPNL